MKRERAYARLLRLKAKACRLRQVANRFRWFWIVPALMVFASGCATRDQKTGDPMPAFSDGARILFQGDSITDGNRGRNADPNHILGHGYQFLIAAHYGAELAERDLVFMNRGISGNRVSDLARRWQKDTIDLKPDLLSILIGMPRAACPAAPHPLVV